MTVPDAPTRRALSDWLEPADLFDGISAAHAFWLDAGPEARDGWSWIGEGAPGERPDPDLADTVPAAAAAGGPFRGGWVGWAAYDAAAARAGAPAHTDDTVPGEAWLRVRRVVAFDHGARRVWLHAPADELDDFERQVDAWRAGAASAPAAPTPAPSTVAVARHGPDAYAALIDECRAAIRRGDAYQLCLTTRFSVSTGAQPIDPVDVFRRLRAATASHHAALIRSGDVALVSASPERFLQLDGATVRTSPIKGTRPRGDAPAADAALARELVESPKERAENVMIVDLMRNDLQRVCAPGTVTVERLLAVETYPAVHQLVSTVAGRLRPGIRLGDVLDATFPAGSMTGAPKRSAMTILHRLEAAPRGLFAGCFGWVGSDGRADLAMVIRSVVVHPGGAYVGAGGGITWGSDADAEVDEVALKARAPLAALGAALPPRWAERVR